LLYKVRGFKGARLGIHQGVAIFTRSAMLTKQMPSQETIETQVFVELA
jgi:hypothetical protein